MIFITHGEDRRCPTNSKKVLKASLQAMMDLAHDPV